MFRVLKWHVLITFRNSNILTITFVCFVSYCDSSILSLTCFHCLCNFVYDFRLCLQIQTQKRWNYRYNQNYCNKWMTLVKCILFVNVKIFIIFAMCVVITIKINSREHYGQFVQLGILYCACTYVLSCEC